MIIFIKPLYLWLMNFSPNRSIHSVLTKISWRQEQSCTLCFLVLQSLARRTKMRLHVSNSNSNSSTSFDSLNLGRLNMRLQII